MPSFEAVSGMVDAGLNKDSIDDRKMLVSWISSLQLLILMHHV